jgi:Glu-tRNA(Gln) amidotransferase subunit E-like FAD-binding protein
MKAVMSETNGSADGKRINQMVRKSLKWQITLNEWLIPLVFVIL